MRDPYVYEGTDVLINKFNIKNKNELDELETEYLIFNIDSLKNGNFQINSIFDVLEIHKQLFSVLYEWAGQIRTIDIYKGETILNVKSIDYVFASYIKQALLELDKEYQSTHWEQLDNKEIITKICYFVSEFWHIHPFREGNTRTAAMMLYLLLKKSNMHINTKFLSKNSKYFRNSLVLNCLYSNSKPEYLFEIVTDLTTIKDLSDNKYKTIDGYDVDKYVYRPHTINKIKTIKTIKDIAKK